MSPEEIFERNRKRLEANKRLIALNMQSNKPPAKPKQSFFNKVRDKFDANTEADQYRRQVKGDARLYSDQQKNMGRTRISNNPFQRGTNTFRSLAETIKQPYEGLGKGISTAFGEGASLRDYEAKTQQENLAHVENLRKQLTKPTTSLADRAVLRSKIGIASTAAQNSYNRQIAQTQQLERDADPRKQAGNIIQIGTDLAGLGVAGFAGKEFGTNAAKLGFRQAAKKALPAIGQNAALNVVQGGAGELQSNDPTMAGALRKAALGGAIGTVADLTLGGFAALPSNRAYKNVVKELADETDGAVVRDTVKEIANDLPEETIDDISKQITKASDEATVDQIIRQAALDEGKITAPVRKTFEPLEQVPTSGTVTKDPAIILGFKQAKTPEQARDSVKALFPELDDKAVNKASQELAKATDDNQVAQALERAQTQRKAVTEGVDNATPAGEIAPTPEQQIAEVAQEQPTAPVTSQQPVNADIQANQAVQSVDEAAAPVNAVQDAVTPLADGERYTTTNADVSFGSDSNGGVVSYKPDGAGTRPKQVRYNQLSEKTRTELITAEQNYARAKANSKGFVKPGTRGEVQIAREQLDIAQSNAIEELGLQDYANKVDSSGNVIQKTYNDRYIDWAEAKYKSLNPDEREIFAKDGVANPEKYKAQFEAESRSANQVIAPEAPTAQAPIVPGAVDADGVPNTIQSGVLATEAARKSGQQGKIKTFLKAAKRELVDPLQEWQRADDQLAKRLNVREQDLDPERALTQLYTRVQQSANESSRLAQAPTRTGESLAQVMNRNMGNENEFMQYMNQKFALEILQKAEGNPKMWKIKGFTPEEVSTSVARYEQANPQAITDAATVKAWADSLIDKGVAAGEITPEFGDFIKTKYQSYVPLSKVYDEDLVRPRITGGMGTNVAEQNVVRFLGEGAAEFDDTFESLITRGEAVTKKANQNIFNNELLRRAKEGDASLNLVVDPDKVVQRREIVTKLKELREVLGKAKKARGKLATKKAISKEQLASAQTEAAERMRQYYVSQAPDGSNGGFAQKMSKQELLDMFEVATEASEVKAKRIANKLAKKGAQYKEAVAMLDELRAEIGVGQDAARELFKGAARLKQKATPNKNLIRGFRGGDEFAVEVNPQMARQAEYTNSMYDGTAGNIGNISSTVAAPAKAVYTGFLAPVFGTKQIIKQQGTKFIQSEGLSAFGARPLTTGYGGGFFASGQFYNDLVENGFKPVVGTKVGKKPSITAKQVAAGADKWSKLKYTVKSPKQWLQTINSLAGRLDTADRVQIAKGEFLRRKRMNYSDAEAMRFAARQANDALGDFQRVSKLARGMEAVAPYSGATQSGNRALMRRFKTNPVQTTVKVATILAPVMLAAKYGAEKYGDYYEDMIESGRTFDLDSNAVIITPGAHRATDEEVAASNGELKDGDWVGVIKIPVAPDYNPLTRMAWKTGYALSKGEAPDMKMLTSELGNFLTADQKRNFYDTSMGREGIGRVLPSSSIKNFGVTAAGVDPRTGKPLASEYIRTKERTEQYDASTSESAKKLSGLFQGVLTPQQVDSLFNQTGYMGDIAQSAVGGGLKQAAIAPFKKAFFGSKGQSEGSKYYQNLEEVGNTFFTDEKQFQAWKEMKARRTDAQGNKTDSGMLDSAKNALTLLSNEQTFKAEAEMNRRQSKRTGNSNPLLDDTLTPEQRRAVLTYRSMRVNNAAKQNYTKDGEPAFTSLGLDEQWYRDFQNKESAFWDKIEASKARKTKLSEAQGKAPTSSSDSEEYSPRTFSGAKRPELTDEQKAKEDIYYTLPKGTGDRSRFLKANPWLINHWDAMNGFTNEERLALGFKPLEDEESKSGGSGYGKFGYSKGGKSGSGGGGSGKGAKLKTPKTYITELLGNVPNISSDEIAIRTAPKRAKFKVKTPSGKGRNYKKIKLS